jgi:hypothetical protein
MEIIANDDPNVYKILQALTGPVPLGRRIFYQKHMTHHLLPKVDRVWLGQVTNCFLIRDPAAVIASYIKKDPSPALDDLGFVQQAEIFEWVSHRTGSAPAVIDARDVLENPDKILRLLCAAVGVEFDEAMLTWAPGFRDTDGIWAKYWYDEVASSTCFQPYRPKNALVPEHLREIHDRCRESYEQLYEYRLH